MYRWGILRAFVRAVSAFQFASSNPGKRISGRLFYSKIKSGAGMLGKLPLLWQIPGENSPVMNSYEFVRRKL